MLGPGRALRRAIEADRIPSMILWGPPGCGKTTIARLLANSTAAFFEAFSAVLGGVKQLREIIERAQRRRRTDPLARTLLFVDEIHRFNKAQQDAFLPHVESGLVTLVGATTENPSFQVNGALLSRCAVHVLKPLTTEALVGLLERALSDAEEGVGTLGLTIERPALEQLVAMSGGDARRSLGALERIALHHRDRALDAPPLTIEELSEALGESSLLYDRSGEEHYNVVSAYIKSMRASDPDASVYYLARMLEAGEDPVFVARRLVIFAGEDIGNAEPQALMVTNQAAQAAKFIGMPEAIYPLTQATIFCALAPKSDTAKRAYSAARQAIRMRGVEEVPLDIRNAPTKLMKNIGYGRGYSYPHEHPEGVDPQHRSHLPVALRATSDAPRMFVHSSSRGWEARAEAELAARLSRARGEGASPAPPADDSDDSEE